MKHTDFYNKLEEIKRQEQRELKEALKAHGGSYSWCNEESGVLEDTFPCIAVNLNAIDPTPTDIAVRSVYLNHVDYLCFEGEDNCCGDIIEFCSDDVFAGHIAYIIEMIPETDAVNDVTSREEDFVITSVCRDDLINIGFDAEHLSDEDMQHIANIMGDLYCNYDYSDNLLEAARKLGLKQLNNE